MAWSRQAWVSASGTTIWTDILTFSKPISWMTPIFFTATMGRAISMTSRERLGLESKPDTFVGEQGSWIWTTMAFQTFSWLPGMSTRKWNGLSRNIPTKHRAWFFGIWATGSLKSSSKKQAPVWGRPIVVGDALLETSTMMG